MFLDFILAMFRLLVRGFFFFIFPHPYGHFPGSAIHAPPISAVGANIAVPSTTAQGFNIVMQNTNKNSNFHFFINFIKSPFAYFLIASKNSSKLSEIAQKKNNS